VRATGGPLLRDKRQTGFFNLALILCQSVSLRLRFNCRSGLVIYIIKSGTSYGHDNSHFKRKARAGAPPDCLRRPASNGGDSLKSPWEAFDAAQFRSQGVGHVEAISDI